MSVTHHTLTNLSDTKFIAEQLTTQLPCGSLAFFSGEIGAGKTTLIQSMLAAWGYKQPVRSPTFTLVESYHCHCPIYHFDLYRIESIEELEIIDFRSYVAEPEAILLVEWPEKAAGYLPSPSLHCTFTMAHNQRQLTVVYNDN